MPMREFFNGCLFVFFFVLSLFLGVFFSWSKDVIGASRSTNNCFSLTNEKGSLIDIMNLYIEKYNLQLKTQYNCYLS